MVGAGILGSYDCRVAPIPLALGLQTRYCLRSRPIRPARSWCSPAAALDGPFRIDIPPERGTLTPGGRTGVVYRPRPGFKGTDVFDFSLRGRSSAAYETATIRVRASIN